MTNGHGGARSGAGRKCDPQVAHLRNLVGTVMTDDDWIKIIQGLVDDAQSGDLRSISFLLALSHGISPQSLLALEEPAPAGTRPQAASAAAALSRKVPARMPASLDAGTLGAGTAEMPNPAGIAPTVKPARPVIHDLRKSSQLQS